MAEIQNGREYRDKITGFRGICIGIVDYLTGCNQALILPKAKADGSYTEGCWIDLQRLEETDDVSTVVLDNGRAPGAGPTPTRSTPPTR